MHHHSRILNALIVSSLGAGAWLGAADSQLPESPFIVPPAGKPGAGTTPAPAAPPAADTSGPTITGFVDTTYNYNLNRPSNNTNQYYGFGSQANTFALNNAQIALTGNPKGDKEVTYLVKLNYGTDATAETPNGFASSPTASNLDVEEAWGAWVDPSTHLGLKVGKFVTYEGTEVIESINDPTVTRGLLFSLAEPFTHVGALGTWQVTDKVDLALGIVNGWDLITDNNTGKTGVAKIGINLGDPLLLTVSALYGPEEANDNTDKRGSVDVTGLTKVISHVDLNFQVNYGWERNGGLGIGLPADGRTYKWFGFGIQPVIHITPKVTIGTRFELFDDMDGARTNPTPGSSSKQRLISFTVAPGYTFTDHFLVRGEARLDVSNQQVYLNSDGVVDKKVQSTLAAEAIYSF